jgi:hypothetical protein
VLPLAFVLLIAVLLPVIQLKNAAPGDFVLTLPYGSIIDPVSVTAIRAALCLRDSPCLFRFALRLSQLDVRLAPEPAPPVH